MTDLSGVRLAIDVGRVRIGVATCDPEQILATPVETVSRQPDSSADLDRLAELARRRHAGLVYVGLPRSLNGSEGPAAVSAREYAMALARRIAPVSVRLIDERLTTVTASDNLREAGMKSKKGRRVIDQQAAVVLLQTALDVERHSGTFAGEVVALDVISSEGSEDAT